MKRKMIKISNTLIINNILVKKIQKIPKMKVKLYRIKQNQRNNQKKIKRMDK